MSRNNQKISLDYTDASLAATTAADLATGGMLDGTIIITREGVVWRLVDAAGTWQLREEQSAGAAPSGVAFIATIAAGQNHVDVPVTGIQADAVVALTFAQAALDSVASGPLTYVVSAPGTLTIQASGTAFADIKVAVFVANRG